MNPAASPETLKRVAQHPNASVAVLPSIIANPSTDADLVEDIALFPHSGYNADIATAVRIYRAAVTRIDLPASVLTWLAHNCSDASILEEVARHPNTPEADAVVAVLSSRSPTQQEVS